MYKSLIHENQEIRFLGEKKGMTVSYVRKTGGRSETEKVTLKPLPGSVYVYHALAVLAKHRDGLLGDTLSKCVTETSGTLVTSGDLYNAFWNLKIKLGLVLEMLKKEEQDDGRDKRVLAADRRKLLAKERENAEFFSYDPDLRAEHRADLRWALVTMRPTESPDRVVDFSQVKYSLGDPPFQNVVLEQPGPNSQAGGQLASSGQNGVSEDDTSCANESVNDKTSSSEGSSIIKEAARLRIGNEKTYPKTDATELARAKASDTEELQRVSPAEGRELPQKVGLKIRRKTLFATAALVAGTIFLVLVSPHSWKSLKKLDKQFTVNETDKKTLRETPEDQKTDPTILQPGFPLGPSMDVEIDQTKKHQHEEETKGESHSESAEDPKQEGNVNEGKDFVGSPLGLGSESVVKLSDGPKETLEERLSRQLTEANEDYKRVIDRTIEYERSQIEQMVLDNEKLYRQQNDVLDVVSENLREKIKLQHEYNFQLRNLIIKIQAIKVLNLAPRDEENAIEPIRREKAAVDLRIEQEMKRIESKAIGTIQNLD